MKIDGYDIDWDSFRMSTCGEVGYAYKDGVKKFCKRFNAPVDAIDNGTLSPQLAEKRRKEFQNFAASRTEINRMAAALSAQKASLSTMHIGMKSQNFFRILFRKKKFLA